MTTGPTADPFSFFREALTQWEKSANEIGTKVLGTEKAVELMHKSTTASLQMQNAMKDGMNKALAVANMPSKADIDALSAQIGTLEGRLARIEDLLTGNSASVVPKPKRTRTPPAKS
jgi:polyhydroxyalkanoate synthesis regulator phasin